MKKSRGIVRKMSKKSLIDKKALRYIIANSNLCKHATRELELAGYSKEEDGPNKWMREQAIEAVAPDNWIMTVESNNEALIELSKIYDIVWRQCPCLKGIMNTNVTPELERLACEQMKGQTMNDKFVDMPKRMADKYENADFIASDPVQFPRRYSGRDAEVSGFITSWLSFGNRKAIIGAAEMRKCLDKIFDLAIDERLR